MTDHATRKEQIEKSIARKLFRDLRKAGAVLNREEKARVCEALRSAAMVAGCEERGRTLRLIREQGAGSGSALATRITNIGVLDVLGYKE